MVTFVDGHEAHGVEGAIDEVEIVLGEVMLFEQEGLDFAGRIVIAFETNCGTFPSVMKLYFNGLQEI